MDHTVSVNGVKATQPEPERARRPPSGRHTFQMSVTLFCSDGMMREVVGTVLATTVAPEDTFPTATEYCAGPVDVFQLSVGVSVFPSCLAATSLQAKRPVGGGTMKYTPVRSCCPPSWRRFRFSSVRSIQEGAESTDEPSSVLRFHDLRLVGCHGPLRIF
jgi:hypothetical protein